MEIFNVEYEGKKIPVQKSENGSIFVLLPTRFGDRGSEFRETIVHEKRGWRFTSTQNDCIDYYFHLWLKEDGCMAWANDMTYGIQEFNTPFNPYYPNAGVLNDTALKLYNIVKQIEDYQKRDIPATELLLLRQYYLNTALKALGYDSVDDVIQGNNNSNGYLSLNKIASQLEDYTDLSKLVISIGEVRGEESFISLATENMDRKKALELGATVKDQIQENIEFMQGEEKTLSKKRIILPEYRTKMEERMGVYTYDNYQHAVRNIALLLLELNPDLLTEEQRKSLELPEYTVLEDIALKDKISKLIDSKDFNNACEAENAFAHEQAEELIKIAKEIIDDGKSAQYPLTSTPELIKMVNEERTISADRKRALDNNERYKSKNRRKPRGYSLDDE